MRRCTVSLAVLVTALVRTAFAQDAGDAGDAEVIDADGDGDIDDDDRLILAASETITIESKSDAQVLRESARAVTVIDTRQARERTADLGEVLSRAQGIQVRRSGGLGSAARFSLNGLYDDQIRFFLDGVPLELAGWGSGIANVPVELVERIEVHRGVVPVTLGADALGGAVDLVTDHRWVDRAAASWQVGSFGTQRGSAVARARDDDSGAVLGLSLFLDRADNDYLIDVEVADERGRTSPARVPRFHDAYLAAGGSVEIGVVERGRLRRAIARLYATDTDKEIAHNAVMTVPYGAAEYGETARGVTADVLLGDPSPEGEPPRWSVRALAGIARRRIDFVDLADAVYDWYGREVRARVQPGEIGEAAYQLVTETGSFARLSGELRLGRRQQLSLTVAPTRVQRGGDDFLDHNPGGRDPLSARRDLLQLVTGVEHQLGGGDDRWQNVAFAKHYAMWTDAEDILPGYLFAPITQRLQRFGVGDAARLRVRPGLIVKTSYEWATRLPSVDEIFGDGILVLPNLELRPEVSHNLNLGAQTERETGFGAVGGEVNLFARLADDLIIVIGNDRNVRHQNVYAARIAGVEGTAGWVAPGEWASVDATITVQDIRNASDQGTFGDFEGDRIPNRPWLLGSLGASVRRHGVLRAGDELIGFASSRYVREFYRGWESLGTRSSKQVVPTQLVHGAGVTYAMRGVTPLVGTLELQNLTDARAFDSFGVQRPGRALYFKISGEL